MGLGVFVSNKEGSETYWTATFKNNATLMNTIQEIFVEEVENIKNVTGFGPACVFQAITMDIISHFSKNGGNALGITPEDGPLIRIQLTPQPHETQN